VNIFNPKELEFAIETLSNTEDLLKSDLITILEEVFSVSCRQNYDKEADIIASIKDDYTLSIQRRHLVVDDNWSVLPDGISFSSHCHVYEDEVEEKIGEAHLAGEYIVEKIAQFTPNRHNVDIAKQQLKLKLKQYKKDQLRARFSKENELVSVIIKNFDPKGYTVEYAGEYVGYLPHTNLFNARERLKVGNQYQCLFDYTEASKNHKHDLCFSRKGSTFIKAVMKKEIPDIANEIIRIMGVACVNGHIVISVYSSDRMVDAIGSCVGARGTRISNVMYHLAGESVELVEWSSQETEMIQGTLKDLDLLTIIEEEDGYVLVVNDDEKIRYLETREYRIKALSALLEKEVKLIGRVELNNESNPIVHYFEQALNMDKESAEFIAGSGYTSLDDMLRAGVRGLCKEMDISVEMASEVIDGAILYIQYRDKHIEESYSALLSIKTLDFHLIDLLEKSGHADIKAVAEMDRFEIMDILPIDDKYAGQIIMECREK
jgi:N utilization substance protein A